MIPKRQNYMQCFHECLCGGSMKVGPVVEKDGTRIMRCIKCRIDMTEKERNDMIKTVESLAETGKPITNISSKRLGPFFYGIYNRSKCPF